MAGRLAVGRPPELERLYTPSLIATMSLLGLSKSLPLAGGIPG